jgi:DNA primase
MADKPGWIDFKELRQRLKFVDVLEHYKVKVTVKGDRATGYCPLPTHQGKRNSPSFSVNVPRRIWQCFGCHAKGNVLDFACRMEGFNPDDPKQLRKAAFKIMEVFFFGGAPPVGDEPASAVAVQATPKNVLVNVPIDFELKALDPDHPYLKERGFTDATIRHFGLGYCNRGMLKGRVAVPLHDPQGRLVGYAGRLTKDADISEANPKYRFPGSRERDGKKLEFRKSLLLYNAHRIKEPVDHLFVVEGFPATWWLWQAEYRTVVALMGADCSETQAKIIVDLVKPNGKVWVIPDGNEAGERCAKSVLEQVSPYRFCRWVRLTDDQQPTDFPPDELVALFG